MLTNAFMQLMQSDVTYSGNKYIKLCSNFDDRPHEYSKFSAGVFICLKFPEILTGDT